MLLLKSFLDIIFPPLCHICKSFIPAAGVIHLCAGCRERIVPVSSPHCTVCGIPFITEHGIDHPCGTCLIGTRHFNAARSAFLHEGSVKELIHSFKYNRNVRLARPLGLLAVEHLASFAAGVSPELIIPVPLHKKRLRERGFNQAVLLGETMSSAWQVPLSRHNLRRIRWTEPQINLSAGLRQENVRNAFALSDQTEVKGKRVLLVDDVYTTGSTVGECARVLKKEGASVFVVTVARAL